MRRRELIIKNYGALLPWLETQSYNHRYFLHFYSEINGKQPKRSLDESDKIQILEILREKLAKMKKLSDDEFDAVQERGECPCTLLFHDHNVEMPIQTHYLFGNLRIIDVLVENKDGSEAEFQRRIEELVDGEWVDRGIFE